MRHWLIKFAPFRTSWHQIVRAGTFTIRGVRSPEARNHLAAMCVNDLVFFYHSQQERAIVGVLEVTREAYPDPTSADPRWLTCDFVPVRAMRPPIQITILRADERLVGLPLLRQPRLSVMPVEPMEWQLIVELESL